MILGFFIQLISWIAGLLISLLPSSEGLPSGIDSALSGFLALANSMNYLFPVDTLLQVLVLTIGVSSAMLLFDFIMWTKGLFHKHT